MSIKLIDSNIIINDGTSNFILDRVRSSGKQNDTIELNAPTVSNADINDLSLSSDEKYIVFTYDSDMNYNKLDINDTNLITWYKLNKNSSDSSGKYKNLTEYSSPGFYDDAAFF